MYCQQLLTACLCLVIAVDLLEAKRAFNKHKSRNTHNINSLRRALSSQTKRQSVPPFSVECVGDKFPCVDRSYCIPISWACNGFIDCDDGSDEAQDYCLPRDCPNGRLKCPTGECIDKDSYCAGYSRCFKNGAVITPVTCPQVDCESGYTKCPTSAKCIREVAICNTKNDCGDNSDEDNCGERTCEADEVRCNSGQCIKKADYCVFPWLSSPCTDRSDLTGLCLSFTCPRDYYKCHSDGKCISSFSICDDYPDCADGSDEAGTTCDNRVCGEDQVRCASGQCLPRDIFCSAETLSFCRDGSLSPTDPTICGNAAVNK